MGRRPMGPGPVGPARRAGGLVISSCFCLKFNSRCVFVTKCCWSINCCKIINETGCRRKKNSKLLFIFYENSG